MTGEKALNSVNYECELLESRNYSRSFYPLSRVRAGLAAFTHNGTESSSRCEKQRGHTVDDGELMQGEGQNESRLTEAK